MKEKAIQDEGMRKFGADGPDRRRMADDSPVVVDLRLVPEPETVSSYPLASGRMERRFPSITLS